MAFLTQESIECLRTKLLEGIKVYFEGRHWIIRIVSYVLGNNLVTYPLFFLYHFQDSRFDIRHVIERFATSI